MSISFFNRCTPNPKNRNALDFRQGAVTASNGSVGDDLLLQLIVTRISTTIMQGKTHSLNHRFKIDA